MHDNREWNLVLDISASRKPHTRIYWNEDLLYDSAYSAVLLLRFSIRWKSDIWIHEWLNASPLWTSQKILEEKSRCNDIFVWKDEERTFWWFVQILIILMIDLQTLYGSQCEDFCKQLEALAKGKDQRFVFSHAAWSNPKRCVSRPVRCAGWCEVGVHLGLTVDLLYLVKDTYAPSLGYELLLKLLNT